MKTLLVWLALLAVSCGRATNVTGDASAENGDAPVDRSADAAAAADTDASGDAPVSRETDANEVAVDGSAAIATPASCLGASGWTCDEYTAPAVPGTDGPKSCDLYQGLCPQPAQDACRVGDGHVVYYYNTFIPIPDAPDGGVTIGGMLLPGQPCEHAPIPAGPVSATEL